VANAPLSASLNTGYALAVIEAAGHNPEYLDFLSASVTVDQMVAQTLATAPDCVLIHWVYCWDDGAAVATYIDTLRRQTFTGSVGAFGFFPTCCGADLLRLNSGLDFVLVGEFEDTLAELSADPGQHASVGSVPGLHTRRGFQGRRPLISNLDLLPFPRDVGRNASLNCVNVAASRGCYGACTFCCIHPYYGQSRWRARTVANVVREIQQRTESRSCREVYFVDPNFFGPGTAGQQRARDLGSALRGTGLTFGLEARVNDIHVDTISVLADAGLASVFLGMESASATVLERMSKRISPAQSARAVRILRDAGVSVTPGFIMFDPDSTLADLRLNLDFLETNGLLEKPDHTANVLYHNQIILKGTPAYLNLERQGRLRTPQLSLYEARTVYRHDEVQVVADAVGTIARRYFRNFDRFWQRHGLSKLEADQKAHCLACPELPETQINRVLTDSFRELLDTAERGQLSGVTELRETVVARIDALFDMSAHVHPVTKCHN